MAPLMGVSKLSRLSLLLFLSTIIPSAYASNVFSRQAQTCGGMSGLSQCGNGFPSEFCCPQNTDCLPLNATGSVSVICCPKGSKCSFIQPVTCDMTQYNATLHPDNSVHLANFTAVDLPKCGKQCCPLGYTCNGNMCSAESASPTTSSTSTPSATRNPSASQTSAAASTSAPAPIVQTQQGFDGKSFAAGFIPGIILGGLLTLALLWIIKKRRESQEKNRYSGDFGHVARTISDPIYDPVYAARTDFIRRGSHSAQPSPNSTTGMVQRNAKPSGGLTPKIKSMWDRTPKLGFGFSSNLPANGLPAHPAPPPPAVRAGDRDPYTTPRRTPRRTTSTRSRSTSIGTQSIHQPNQNTNFNRPLVRRSGSTETIDVVMPGPGEALRRPPSFLQPPKAPGMRENRFTQDSGHTTFTKLMERAGYEESSRDDVRNYKASPAKGR